MLKIFICILTDLGFATEAEMVEKLTKLNTEEGLTNTDFLAEEFLGGIVFTNTFPNDTTFPDNIEVIFLYFLIIFYVVINL